MLRSPRGLSLLALICVTLTLALLFLFPRSGAEAGPAPPVAEREALAAILDDGHLQVRQLASGLEGLTAGPARRELNERIREAKEETRLRLLETKLDFARERGDLESVQSIEAVIFRIENPRPPAATPAAAPAAKPAHTKGGAR